MIGQPIKLIQWLYNKDKNKIYKVEEYKESRNKEQNGKYWKLLYQLAYKLNLSVEELHFKMLKEFSTRYEILVPRGTLLTGIDYYEKKSIIKKNGKEFEVYYVFTPSHELNTSEFSKLLQGLCEYCKEQDIETLSPDELKRYE